MGRKIEEIANIEDLKETLSCNSEYELRVEGDYVIWFGGIFWGIADRSKGGLNSDNLTFQSFDTLDELIEKAEI